MAADNDDMHVLRNMNFKGHNHIQRIDETF